MDQPRRRRHGTSTGVINSNCCTKISSFFSFFFYLTKLFRSKTATKSHFNQLQQFSRRRRRQRWYNLSDYTFPVIGRSSQSFLVRAGWPCPYSDADCSRELCRQGWSVIIITMGSSSRSRECAQRVLVYVSGRTRRPQSGICPKWIVGVKCICRNSFPQALSYHLFIQPYSNAMCATRCLQPPMSSRFILN